MMINLPLARPSAGLSTVLRTGRPGSDNTTRNTACLVATLHQPHVIGVVPTRAGHDDQSGASVKPCRWIEHRFGLRVGAGRRLLAQGAAPAVARPDVDLGDPFIGGVRAA